MRDARLSIIMAIALTVGALAPMNVTTGPAARGTKALGIVRQTTPAFRSRFTDCRRRSFLEGSLWWLAHNANAQDTRMVMQRVARLLPGGQKDSPPPDGDGIQVPKGDFRDLLRSDDAAVRGTAAIIVDIIGD